MGAPKNTKIKIPNYKVLFAPIRYTPIERVCVCFGSTLSCGSQFIYHLRETTNRFLLSLCASTSEVRGREINKNPFYCGKIRRDRRKKKKVLARRTRALPEDDVSPESVIRACERGSPTRAAIGLRRCGPLLRVRVCGRVHTHLACAGAPPELDACLPHAVRVLLRR